DQAYKKYLNADTLGARAHLYKARAALRGSNSDGLRLRIASLESLLDMGEIADTFLILKTGLPKRLDQSLDQPLLSEKGANLGGKSEGKDAAWVELFSAYQLYYRGDINPALDAWQHMAKDEHQSLDVRALSALGVLEIAGETLIEAKKRGVTSPIT